MVPCLFSSAEWALALPTPGNPCDIAADNTVGIVLNSFFMVW
jgi:hypothetical protein